MPMFETRFPELFENLLKSRGLSETLAQEDFLNPQYEKLHSPLLLPNIERAVDRFLQAIRKGEHIAIYSDYDADGIPGAVVFSDFFRRIGYENVSFYIPHRHTEGFGLNHEAIDEIAERGAKLILTIDCGVADKEEVSHANNLGLDVIITDHHEPPEELPEAYAVVNPRLKGSEYPFKDLCGSAVGYKFIQALLEKDSFGLKPGLEKWSLDMVGIATLSDMVPLIGENRILARYGLEVLRKSPRPGLRALLDKLKIDQKNLTEDDIGFMITPRINVASRMGEPKDAFNLLATNNPVEALKLVSHLEHLNNERKGLVGSMVKEAKHELSQRESLNTVIVVGNPEWRPSLLGLVANSLVEEYERPVFVWGRDGDGVIKGSCRSYNGYNLFELMNLSRSSFIECGGHRGAGGFSVSLENLISLERVLAESLLNLSIESQEESLLHPVSLDEIGEDLWNLVSRFAPFGMANEKPLFKLTNVPIKSMKQFGKTKEHLELVLGSKLKAISFFSTPESFKIDPKQESCTVHAHLEKSFFLNRPEIRLRIVEIRP